MKVRQARQLSSNRGPPPPPSDPEQPGSDRTRAYIPPGGGPRVPRALPRAFVSMPLWGRIRKAQPQSSHFRLVEMLMALPFFGASIPGFVGLLTGRGPFSPAFALIPGRSMLIVSELCATRAKTALN